LHPGRLSDAVNEAAWEKRDFKRPSHRPDLCASQFSKISAFQTWSYNTSTAQLTNLNANGQLYNASPTAGVGSQSPAPGNQWYLYPNYIVG
jgi:hypothetical protein